MEKIEKFHSKRARSAKHKEMAKTTPESITELDETKSIDCLINEIPVESYSRIRKESLLNDEDYLIPEEEENEDK